MREHRSRTLMLVNVSSQMEGWEAGGGWRDWEWEWGRGRWEEKRWKSKAEESAPASRVMSGVVDWWPSVAT